MRQEIKEILRAILIIAALASMIAGSAMLLDKGSEGFEATVIFYLSAILCLLWAQTYTKETER